MIVRRRGQLSLALLAGASAIAIAGAVPAVAQEAARSFDIPAQPLSSALLAYSRQTDTPVIASMDLLAGKSAPEIKGDMPEGQALAMLLQGTGLRAQRGPTGSIVVERITSDPQSGSAAGDGADNGTVQALIVTAQKREENIQDVPIAMSAFTQEDLTKSQVTGGPDLMTQVPNFTFTKTNFSGYSIQIRGIGTQAISATTDAAVAVAFNNTPFIRNRFFEQEFYDLERVEVLRGPQGTLYGRNATAGVVNIISAKPSFHYEAKLSADVGNYSSSRLEGMVNVPLVDDKVALRIAGAWTKRDGYDTNQITGNQIDGRDLWSTRVSLRFAPTDKINTNLIWEHFQEDDDRLRSGKQLCHTDVKTKLGPFTVNDSSWLIDPGQGGWNLQTWLSQGCAPASLYAPESFQTPNGHSLPYYFPLGLVGVPTALDDPYVSRTQSHDLRAIDSTVDPKYRAKNDTVELQIAVDLSDTLSLTSETAWASDFIFSTQDFNRFNTAHGAWRLDPDDIARGILDQNGVFCDPQVGCSDRMVAVDLSTAKSHHFSQELRLASNFDGPFNFSIGANFLRYDTEDKYYVFINSLGLVAAESPIGYDRPYHAGVTDNSECLTRGFISPDPTISQPILGCTYMDPNPIGSLNDLGHNYFLSRNPYKLISYAAFGEAYYNVTDKLKITAGLRWTVDKKEAPRIPSWLLASNSVGYPVMEVLDQEWREPTGRLTVDWKPDLSFTDETLLYASFAHGYKAGGANPPPFGVAVYHDNDAAKLLDQSATHPKTFNPEFVNAYEVGSKNTLLDGRLTLNSSAFYYDYTGYQISQIIDRSAVNYNFDAKVWGAELEADWRPLENLRLGLKLGYEKTRVANGEKAIDIMDRTAGHAGWVVVKPFPSIPSNCILPEFLFVGTAGGAAGVAPVNLGFPSGGGASGCELAYLFHDDPVTGAPYVDLTNWVGPITTGYGSTLQFRPGYTGWNPATAPNNGEGFDKDLSGHELPNAPHYTTTVTADYTVPLPSSWLMTLHGDFYYQSEAWTRIFNTPGYDKLKAYTNVNLAAIFTDEDVGWKVMAYVKNVFDKTNITGAFLNSDDTGLTTNVFLNEPRLYGLRVTKEWTGTGWWTGANPNHLAGEPYPLTVEVGGMVQRQDAPYAPAEPSFIGAFPDSLNIAANAQNRNLDWGDGREVKLTYQPAGGLWSVSAAWQNGRTNSDTARLRAQQVHTVCGFLAPTDGLFCDPAGAKYYEHLGIHNVAVWSDASARNHEDHAIADFRVGYDVGIGGMLERSTVSAGLRYAAFNSSTKGAFNGVPYVYENPGWFYNMYDASHLTRYSAAWDTKRTFKGAGPTVGWDAGARLLGNDQTGRVVLDWSVSAGALFGKQKTSTNETEASYYWRGKYASVFGDQSRHVAQPGDISNTTADIPKRTKSATVPVVDLSLGLSYDIQRIKVSTGYRWERYFNALDGGYSEHKSYDRTIDGPYFKIAVGFGG